MLKIERDERFIFNENYILKHDEKRFELMESVTHELYKEPGKVITTEDVFTATHPLLALLLQLFDGNRSVKEVIRDYCNLTKFDDSYIEKFVVKLIKEVCNSNKGKYLKFGDRLFYLPKNLLLKDNKAHSSKKIEIEDFRIKKDELDLERLRSYVPSDCIFEINFKCFTDCTYCYADRRKKECTISLPRIKEIIREAKSLKMRSFDLSGGEVFLHEDWDIIVNELVENGFMPYISTKIPIGMDIIKRLKELGVKGIQFSIDSLDRNELMHLLKVDGDYLKRITESIENLDKEGMGIAINSQITSINDNLVNVRKMLDYFLRLKNIRSIRFGAAGYSIYKSPANYKKISPFLEKILKAEELINSYKEKYKNISIAFSGYQPEESILTDEKTKAKGFADRARCSGNFYAFVMLPDGQVTVCEELYFHPRFIIGDLKKQSIEEMWNSEKAVGLYELSKEMIRADSACKACDQFEPCHKLKGVCWKNVLAAYGMDNWDYPDPRCPKAPKPYNEYWIK